MPAYKGQYEALITRQDVNHVYGQGWFTSLEAYGPTDKINGLMNELIATGWEFTNTPEGPYSRLTATRQGQPDSYQTDYYDRFTITTETIEKDIWTLDAIHEEVYYEFAGDLELYKSIIEKAIDYGDENWLADYPEATHPEMWATYRELARGADSYEEEYLVLTRERVVSTQYNEQLVLPELNASLIYTTDELHSEFDIPASFTGIKWPTAPTNNIPNTKWGWRHRKRGVQQMESQKVQVIQDWAWAAWSTNIYNALTP